MVALLQKANGRGASWVGARSASPAVNCSADKNQKQRGCTSVCEMLLCSTVALLLVGVRARLVPTFPGTLPAEEPGVWASPFGEVSYSRVTRPWQGRGAASGGLSGLILLGLCI